MSVAPDATRKGHIDTLIVALKTAGVWAKIDVMYLLAAHDSQAARLEWKGNTAYDLTAVNSPTFTTDRGYTGDGATSYLDTAYNPTTAGLGHSQDSAHLAVCALTSSVSAAQDAGGRSSTRMRMTCRVGTAGIATARDGSGINFSASGIVVAHKCVSRTGANTVVAYDNGVQRNTAATASDAISPGIVDILRQNTSYSNRQIACVHTGQGLSAAEDLAASNAVRAYLQAVGCTI